jgi:hypothetical protein
MMPWWRWMRQRRPVFWRGGDMKINLLGTFIVMGIANFGFQFFGDANWALAVDRTAFQGVALFAVYLNLRRMNKASTVSHRRDH